MTINDIDPTVALMMSGLPQPGPVQAPSGPAPRNGIIPAPTNPMAVARELLPGWRYQGLPALYHWKGSWMRWTGSHWEEVDEAEMRATFYRSVEMTTYTETNARGETRAFEWAPNRRKISDLLEATAAISHLPSSVDNPSWLLLSQGEPSSEPGMSQAGSAVYPQVSQGEPGDPSNFEKFPHARKEGGLVACRNGLLNIRTRALQAHTPAYFNTVSVPFDYDRTATQPKQWLDFLDRLWPDDPDAIEVLQEFFGYVLSGRTDLHKILMMVGPTRSGKGTIARILTALVGPENTAGPTLAGLAGNFGMAPLLGKPLAVIGDARFTSSTGDVVVERLLSISGEDTMEVDRKYREPWSGKIPARLVILSNDLPSFSDASGAIANRMIILTMKESWLGREQLDLTDLLSAELPGILNWALDGLERLTMRGRFVEPESSEEARDILASTVSPINAFVADRCVLNADLHTPADALFDAWKTWCGDEGRDHVGTKATFGRKLFAAAPTVRKGKPRVGGRQVQAYVGIALNAPS